uniref:hypothetical protein n=1 Tax=Cutaneotrichosporon cutaneum TaxID=5554 RepID=UPI00226C66B2
NTNTLIYNYSNQLLLHHSFLRINTRWVILINKNKLQRRTITSYRPNTNVKWAETKNTESARIRLSKILSSLSEDSELKIFLLKKKRLVINDSRRGYRNNL